MSSNRENLTLSSSPYWNWICECVGGRRLDHLGNDRVVLLVLYDCSECLEASGVFTNSWASASGLSSTMAMSISSPSFLMRAGLPVCICSRIATALFSQRFRPTPQWLSALVIQFAVDCKER